MICPSSRLQQCFDRASGSWHQCRPNCSVCNDDNHLADMRCLQIRTPRLCLMCQRRRTSRQSCWKLTLELPPLPSLSSGQPHPFDALLILSHKDPTAYHMTVEIQNNSNLHVVVVRCWRKLALTCGALNGEGGLMLAAQTDEHCGTTCPLGSPGTIFLTQHCSALVYLVLKEAC